MKKQQMVILIASIIGMLLLLLPWAYSPIDDHIYNGFDGGRYALLLLILTCVMVLVGKKEIVLSSAKKYSILISNALIAIIGIYRIFDYDFINLKSSSSSSGSYGDLVDTLSNAISAHITAGIGLYFSIAISLVIIYLLLFYKNKD